MQVTIITLKTGEVIEDSIWNFYPEEGWFTLVTKGARSVNGPVDRDELLRAKKDGWNGR